MQFDLIRAFGGLVLLTLLGIGGLIGGGMMGTRTTLMMVLPSMLVFGAIAFVLGVKHGEYRTTH